MGETEERLVREAMTRVGDIMREAREALHRKPMPNHDLGDEDDGEARFEFWRWHLRGAELDPRLGYRPWMRTVSDFAYTCNDFA